MQLELFETNKKLINRIDGELSGVNEQTFNELLKPLQISFSVENGSRLLSHHICESLDSYTQQSQRYVKMGSNAFVVPEEINGTEYEEKYSNTMNELFDFYNKITKLKEEGGGGRKKTVDDYLYGVPIEDGRYVLPISTTTNVMTTLSGEKLVNFLRTVKNMPQKEGSELAGKILEKLPKNIRKKADEFSKENQKDKNHVLESYKEDFDKINKNVVLLNHFEDPLLRSGLGAATSTNSKPASEVLERWKEKGLNEKKSGIVKRVMGYGHDSIIEHARTTFGLEMSLTCYHQFERHRLPNNIRETFERIPVDREFIVPPTVKNSSLYEEFMSKVNTAKSLRKELKEKGFDAASSYLLLNGEGVKVLSSTNARMDNEILADRTCNNAQWEIRDLYNKKLDLLKKTGDLLYDKAGPGCTRGPCPEGALSCGKMVEMRERYGYHGK